MGRDLARDAYFFGSGRTEPTGGHGSRDRASNTPAACTPRNLLRPTPPPGHGKVNTCLGLPLSAFRLLLLHPGSAGPVLGPLQHPRVGSRAGWLEQRLTRLHPDGLALLTSLLDWNPAARTPRFLALAPVFCPCCRMPVLYVDNRSCFAGPTALRALQGTYLASRACPRSEARTCIATFLAARFYDHSPRHYQ